MKSTLFLFFLILDLVGRSKGQAFEIHSHFMDGDVMFTWSHAANYHDVSLTCDGRHLGFTRVYDNKILLSNALDYKIVKVLVRATIRYLYIESRVTYQQSIVEVSDGNSVVLTLPVPTSPNNAVRKVFQLTDTGASLIRLLVSAKDLAASPDLLSFAISNVSANDAGYYGVGPDVPSCRMSNGVVLVVSAAPNKPKISGERKVPIGQSTTLRCHSISRSRPKYFKKFPEIVYTWMVNNSEIKFNSHMLAMNVTSNTHVQCHATELLTSISATAFIEPLYGPEAVTMSPKFNTSVELHSGSSFGPVSCSSDCNPPCTYQWRKVNLIGTIEEVFSTSNLPKQIVNGTEPLKYQCVATGDYKNVRGSNVASAEITINVQYLGKPNIVGIVNGNTQKGEIIHAKEGSSAIIICWSAGNPEPVADITVGNEKDVSGLSRTNSEAAYHFQKLECEDTEEITCYAHNEEFDHTWNSIQLHVECSARLDRNAKFPLQYQQNSNEDVVLRVPLISFPKPRFASWIGPTERPATNMTRITQRNKPYLFWIHSEIRMLNGSSFGFYKLSVDEKHIVTVLIEEKRIERPGWIVYLSSLPLVAHITFALGGFILLSCLIWPLCHIGRRNKTRRRHQNTSMSSSGHEAEIQEQPDGRSYPRYTSAPKSDIMKGDYEGIEDHPYHNIHAYHEEAGLKHDHSPVVPLFIEGAAEADNHTCKLDGRIYYCVNETPTSCEGKSEYEGLPSAT